MSLDVSRWHAISHYRSLDGLRCLAIVPVVWHHATPRPLEGLLGRGPLGVDLFFVISGFLITTLLCREREKHGQVALGPFWVRRCLRIFPLYFLVLGAFVLHALFVREHGPVRDHFLRSVLFHATYTSNWFVDYGVAHAIVFAFGWSLAAEEQFYFVWPLVLRFFRGLAAPAFVMLALVGLDQGAERGLLDAPFASHELALRIVRSFATPIGLGSLFALALRDRRTFAVARALLGRRFSAPVAFGLVLAAAARAWPLLVAQLTMVALVGACTLRDDHALAPFTDNRAVRHVGLVSYGIYLLNVPLIEATRRALAPLEAPTVAVFAVGLAVTVLVATITRHLVEVPFSKLRDQYEASRKIALASVPSNDG